MAVEWSFQYLLGGYRGTVTGVDVAWREAVTLRGETGGYRSATITVALELDVATLVGAYSPARAVGVLYANGAPVMSGPWRSVSYEPTNGGEGCVLTLTLTESEDDDQGVYPPSAEWRPERSPSDIFTRWENHADIRDIEPWRIAGFSTGSTTTYEQVVAAERGGAKGYAGPVRRMRSEVLGDLPELSDGQSWPWVIGRAGYLSQGVVAVEQVPGAPAFVFNETGDINIGTVGVPECLFVHGGTASATTCTIFGPTAGATDVLARAEGCEVRTVNVDGSPISYVWMGDAQLVASSIDVSSTGLVLAYYSAWPDEASPSGAGDVLQAVYASATVRVDIAEFARVAVALNRYKLGGVLMRQAKPTEFARQALLPLLPVSIVPGPRGLRPVLHPWVDDVGDAGVALVEGLGLSRASPGMFADADPVAAVELGFGPRVDTAAYTRTAQVTSDQSPLFRVASSMRVDAIQTDYVGDQTTAYLIASDRVRQAAWQPRRVRYAIVDFDSYGPGGSVELYVGRRVTLTDASLRISAQRGIVAEREMSAEAAVVVVELLDSPLATP